MGSPLGEDTRSRVVPWIGDWITGSPLGKTTGTLVQLKIKVIL